MKFLIPSVLALFALSTVILWHSQSTLAVEIAGTFIAVGFVVCILGPVFGEPRR